MLKLRPQSQLHGPDVEYNPPWKSKMIIFVLIKNGPAYFLL